MSSINAIYKELNKELHEEINKLRFEKELLLLKVREISEKLHRALELLSAYEVELADTYFEET